MANLKNASIREMVIDRCLSNRNRKYSTQAIMDACNRVLEEKGENIITSLNTIRSDMRAIEHRWYAHGAEIEEIREGKNKYYRYKNEGFSIYHADLTEDDLNKINELTQFLSRFKGFPQFEWMSEITARFKSSFMATTNHEAIICFDDNLYAEGKQHISFLFDAISNKQAIVVDYQSFTQEQAVEREIHPYYLKEYNNRWFLFGFDTGVKKLTTLALDRIKDISYSNVAYIENKHWNFNEYFEDVIGVSVDEGNPVLSIKLWVSAAQYNYIKTKPIHGSQKVLETRDDNSRIIQIEVQENFELYQLLLSYGENIVVLEPETVRKKMQEHIWFAGENYNKFI